MKSKMISVMLIIAVLALTGCNTKPASISDAKLDLTVWTPQGTDYVPGIKPTENIVEKWLIEKTNVEITNMFGNGGGQWESKLTQLIAGNIMPDLIHCGAGQGPLQFSKLKEVDKTWGLTPEMIKEYAPNIWKRIPEKMWTPFTIDGKIYGIPYGFPLSTDIDNTLDPKIASFDNCNYNDVTINKSGSMWVRDDILKMVYPEAMSYDQIIKLMNEKGRPIGDEILDIPIKTTEEYLDFLYKVSKLNLKEGNKTVYATGLTSGDVWMPLTWLGADFMGYRGHQYMASWDNNRQVIRMPLLEPIVKEAAYNIYKMIRDKVIDPDSPVQTQALLQEKINNGQYAVIPSMWMNPFTMNGKLEKAGKPYRYRPFYTQNPNRAGYEAYLQEPNWSNAVAISKTVSESNLKRVLSWMNVMFGEEFEEVRYWGPKSADLYVENADGTRSYKDEKFQKFFLEGDATALTKQDTKGISTGTDPVGYCSVMFFQKSPKYSPLFLNKKFSYILSNDSGASFVADSPHVKSVLKFPPSTLLAPQFANVELVQKLWSSRMQWEDPYKLAFIARNDQEFEQKWKDAENNLKSLIDVDAMLSQMTEIARKYK